MYDRAITSEPLRKLIKNLFSDGVLFTKKVSSGLQVTAGDEMTVKIQPGFAICNGCLKLEEEEKTLIVQTADENYDRIDTVVLRLDNNASERSCEFHIVTGTPATSPVRPALTRNESVWELGLANLLIPKGSSEIKNSNITDTRLFSGRCGVISSISEFDTTALYQQIQADLSEFQENEQAEFAAWFEAIKNQLSTDAAGNLQLEIEVERARINNLIKMEEGSTTGDAELQDIRIGSDGVIYQTAGEAVREQFRKMSDYTTLQTVRMSDSEMMLGTKISTTGIGIGMDINSLEFVQKAGTCLCRHISVKKGDEFVLVDGINLTSANNQFIIFADSNSIITKTIAFSEINNTRRFVFEEDGCFLFNFEYDLEASEEVFHIERPGRFKPLVLYAEKAEEYAVDSKIGNQVLDAILSGRQILVRVSNADGGNYTAIYSPIYMYQLPNYENNYLYLFYLKDEKQDLAETLGVPIQMPVYGELKMLLSETYNAAPLV